MRTVSFVGHVEYEVEGGVTPQAMILADVDTDGENELVVGSQSGQLYVYKGLQTQPLYHVSDLGMITSVCCGDLMATGQNVIVVTTGSGLVHMLKPEGTSLKHLLSKCLPANVKMALICDVDQDGQVELLVALTDRVVRVYRWSENTLKAISKCELMQQIGNMSLSREEDCSVALLVSQPGAGVVRLRYRSATDSGGQEFHSVDIDDVTRVVKSRKNAWCEVLGAEDGSYALATLDGTLFYVRGNTVQWSLPLHHHLFCLTKLDVTCDGSQEILVSSWDGHTFIVNKDKRAVQFLFEEPVFAFTAGRFGLGASPGDDQGDVACMVYATVNKVVLYHNVRLPVMTTETLIDTVDLGTLAWPEAAGPRQLQRFYSWILHGFPH